MDCAAPGCVLPAQRGGRLCAAHYKRQEREQPGEPADQASAALQLAARLRARRPIREQASSPWDAVVRAACELVDAGDDDAAYAKAEARLRSAINRRALSAGWTPPQRRTGALHVVEPAQLPDVGRGSK